MASYVVRVWVPDRPGALGAVASRIGAVHGDLVGIEILERGAGRAIDELVVDLPDEDLVPLLITEISEVDGVDVEDVRPASSAFVDPRLDALESAAFLVEQHDVVELLEALVQRSTRDLQADWVVVLEGASPTPTMTSGDAPPAPWLQAFVVGSRNAITTGEERGPDDVAWAEMTSGEIDSVILLGRLGRPFRARERRQLDVLARIVDHRRSELAIRSSRLVHPSNGA